MAHEDDRVMNTRRLKTLITATISLFKWKKIVPIVTTVHEDRLLAGKVALIVGGTGGIGLSIARKFKESGCNVVIASRNEEKLQKYKNEIGASSSAVIDIMDVTSFKDKLDAISKANGCIDIVVCCAGVHTDRFGFDYLNVTEEEYDVVMDTNLKGVFFFSQATGRYMIENGIKGHILIISSQSALEASWSPYRLSKRGLSGLVEGVAKKLLPYGIVVNAIGPGPTATDMQVGRICNSIYTNDNEIGRLTMPEEIAEYARLMVSGLGDTIIGTTLYMSGGRGVIDGH